MSTKGKINILQELMDDTMPGGGFHGGENQETLPGGGFHGGNY